MKRVLVLGAGMVAGPLVEYFLRRDSFEVTVADIVPERALRLTAGHPRGRSAALDIEDDARLSSLIAAGDLVVSFVPFPHHPRVAGHCLARGRNLLTASYLSADIKAMDKEAAAKGLIFFNEAGLDPGLDHMEAMRIIDRVRGEGGRVESFVSYCGGLPAPEANTNPFGYKFSWSPSGVLMSCGNAARYLRDGKEIFLPAEKYLDEPARIAIERLGDLEGYPNRDATTYLDAYGIHGAQTVLRGTLRYPGWCRTLKRMREWGLLDDRPRDASLRSYKEFASAKIGLPGAANPADVLKTRFPQEEDVRVVDRLEWLGAFADRPLPPGPRNGLEILAGLMAENMSYRPGERDLVVLRHEITSLFPGGRKETTVSTLTHYGLPEGDSAMARTVSLPAAICGRLILEGAVRQKGVVIPVRAEVYRPVLEELEGYGIRFEEKTTAFS
ncbi:MAG: saccharopine dehydrogenase NADP-binding domain-containing protein [Candidatus Aminicenantes bacterium]|nr:saccharopine dehydrogenase NADP-binding domain-containing protein [Candidatus Aminicenantes bacterium]